MRTHRSVDAVRVALAAALGLCPSSCNSPRPAPVTSGTSEVVAKPGNRFACAKPAPLVVGATDTGYDNCEGGVVRRRAVVDCPNLLGRRATTACSPAARASSDCASDADCRAKPYGACARGGMLPGCYCSYGCVRDSDCAKGNICVCADPVGQCEPASCNAGSCRAGLDCVDYTADLGCGGRAFACQTSRDGCLSDSDCDGGALCSIDPASGSRACSPPRCAVGRPFLIAREARLAVEAARSDWRVPLSPDVASLAPEVRSRLAAHWLDLARMEHASVAAFARFALQLLAVGAPADLVTLAGRAMADETTHAQLAFGLASAYAKRDLGPAPLDVDGCLAATDLQALLVTVFSEGCVGETVAAVEAHEARDHARDPAVRAVLERIAADETRHAELAWRTVAWIVETQGPRAREWVRQALSEALDTSSSDLSSERDPHANDVRAHGVLSTTTRRRLRHVALMEVVWPCARALTTSQLTERTPRFILKEDFPPRLQDPRCRRFAFASACSTVSSRAPTARASSASHSS